MDQDNVPPDSMTDTSPSEPAILFQQMQILTDIEGDLADTAVAIAAPDGPDTSADKTISDSTTLQNAEAMESVLEQSILPAPVPATKEVTPDAQVNENKPTTPVEVSAAAHDASTALSGVTADLTVPVLPETVVPAAREVITDTAAEESTGNIVIEAEEPTIENITEAAVNGKNGPEEEAIKPDPVSPSEIAAAVPKQVVEAVAPASRQATPPRLSLPVQTPYASIQRANGDVTLPQGLTESSPSVITIPDLVRSWRNDPKNPNILLALFDWSIQKTEINDARAWYNALAADNPTAVNPPFQPLVQTLSVSKVQPLLSLINLELALSNFPQVEALFARALKGPSGGITAAADVSVWKAYLHYIRRQNPIVEGASNAEQVRGTVTKAYEFALNECGNDRESGELWQEYIAFLTDASRKNTWETQQQTDNTRKAYQRAICIPLNNVEALWKAYDAFESGLNKLTVRNGPVPLDQADEAFQAKKFLAERSPAYMTARTALRELRLLTDALPRPAMPPHPTFSAQDRAIVASWRAYLKWEEGNPLVIEDGEMLASRIGYALRKCLGEMRHFSELWHYSANYYIKSGHNDEAAGVLQAAVQACPKSVLLTFALADLEEDRKKFPECHTLYNNLQSSLGTDIEALKVTVTAEVDTARGPEIIVPPVENGNIEMNGGSEISKLVEEREGRGRIVAERKGKDVDELATAMSVVWVMYMRFARRAEGIKAARGVFGKARKSPNLTWHVFEGSAMMEYHTNKDSSVAIRIFELGFKLFSEEVDYVVRYLQFLLSINDDTNARALFERSALKISADKARPLWDAWARYEYLYGDLAAVLKLESRFAEVFPNDSPLKRFAQRFTYNGIDEIALRDLGFGLRSRLPPPQPAPHPALAAPAPVAHSPIYKRPAPESPRSPPRRRESFDRSRSPTRSDHGPGPYKRYRAASPPPRRFPLPERDRGPRYNGPPPRERERSPLPPPLPPMPRREERTPLPPAPAPLPPAPVQRDQLDRSGVAKPLAWFIGNLPPARSFDGPTFRPDDIVHLFGSITRDGAGMPLPPPSARAPYSEPDRRYGGPPPPAGARYGGPLPADPQYGGPPPPMRGGRY